MPKKTRDELEVEVSALALDLERKSPELARVFLRIVEALNGKQGASAARDRGES